MITETQSENWRVSWTSTAATTRCAKPSRIQRRISPRWWRLWSTAIPRTRISDELRGGRSSREVAFQTLKGQLLFGSAVQREWHPRRRALKSSLRKLPPLLAVPTGEGRLWLIDGYARARPPANGSRSRPSCAAGRSDVKRVPSGDEERTQRRLAIGPVRGGFASVPAD